jgi:hypothetical protein
VLSSASTEAALGVLVAAILCLAVAYASRNASSAPAGYTFGCSVMGAVLVLVSALIYFTGE